MTGDDTGRIADAAAVAAIAAALDLAASGRAAQCHGVDAMGEADLAPRFTLAYLRASRDCVLLLNPLGRVTFISATGLQAMGIRDLSGVVGRDWWELWPLAEWPRLQADVARARDGAVRRVAVDGTNGRRWEVTITPIVNAEGAVETILVVARDATAAVPGRGPIDG